MKNISLIRKIRKAITGSYFTRSEIQFATVFAYAEKDEAEVWKGTSRERSTDQFVRENYRNGTFNVVINRIAEKRFLNA